MLRRRSDGLYEFRWVESAIIASAPDRLSAERRHALRHRVMSQLGEQEAAPMRGFAGLIAGSVRERWILVPAGVGLAAAIATAIYAIELNSQDGNGPLAASVSGDVIVDGTSQSSVGPGEKVFARSNAWLTFAGGARFGMVEGALLRYSEGAGGRISVELSSGDVTFVSAAQPIDVSRASLLLTMLPGSVARVTLSADGTLVGVTEGQVLANDGGTSSVLGANDVHYFALAPAAPPAPPQGGTGLAPTTTTGGVVVPPAIPASVSPAREPQGAEPGGSAEGPAHGNAGQPGTTESGSSAEKPGGAVPPENSNAGGNGSPPSSDNQTGHSDPPVNSNAGGNANPPANGDAGGSGDPPGNSNAGGNGNLPANSNAGGNGGPPASSNSGGDKNPPANSNAGSNVTPHTNSNAGGNGNAPATSNSDGNENPPPPNNAGTAGAPAAAASNGNEGAAPGQVKKAAATALLAQAPADAPPSAASAPAGSNAPMKGNAGGNAPASSNAGGNAASADAPGHNK